MFGELWARSLDAWGGEGGQLAGGRGWSRDGDMP